METKSIDEKWKGLIDCGNYFKEEEERA